MGRQGARKPDLPKKGLPILKWRKSATGTTFYHKRKTYTLFEKVPREKEVAQNDSYVFISREFA